MLLHMLQRDAVLRGDFHLSSGRTASYYVDVARAGLNRWASQKIGLEIRRVLNVAGIVPRSIGGPLTGAVPMIAGLLASHWIGQTFLLRDSIKPYGAGGRIVGQIDGPVVVVDDVVSSGATLAESVSWLRDEGARVGAAYALVDRDKGARERLADIDCPLLSSYTMVDLGVET